MTKRITALLLCVVMLFSMMPTAMHTHAASLPVISIEADNSLPQPGDTVTYTVYIQSSADVCGIYLFASIPEGLTYVAGSGKTIDGVGETINADGDCSWTDNGLQLSVASSSYLQNIQSKTALATFQCTVDADAQGERTVTLLPTGATIKTMAEFLHGRILRW